MFLIIEKKSTGGQRSNTAEKELEERDMEMKITKKTEVMHPLRKKQY